MAKESFDTLVASADPVAIDCWASWYGPCRMFAPLFEVVLEDPPDVAFPEVDTEVERDLAGVFSTRELEGLARSGTSGNSRAGSPLRATRRTFQTLTRGAP